MARSDLLVSLVRAGASGDSRELATTVEALIAEERAKQHYILADRLERALRNNGKGGPSHAVAGSAVRARDYVLETPPRKRLEDLFLPELCERACRELIEEQQRASLLRSHSLEPRHRLLLVGPPGNGKTSLAEAIAEALAVPFFVVRYDAIIGSFLGETASRLRRVFDYARTTPCVLFFDEFDAVGKERGDVNETGEIKRVVTSLLMQVDALPSYTVVIAASNHSELLDRAVWRRFQFRLELPAPTRAQVRLANVLEEDRDGLSLLDDPSSIAPERALVLEVAGSVVDFQALAARVQGLEFLGDEEIEFDPDEDFFEPDTRMGREGEPRTERPLGGRVYVAS